MEAPRHSERRWLYEVRRLDPKNLAGQYSQLCGEMLRTAYVIALWLLRAKGGARAALSATRMRAGQHDAARLASVNFEQQKTAVKLPFFATYVRFFLIFHDFFSCLLCF